MGHQFPRAVVAAAVALTLAGCGGADDDGEPPPVLDVAREQVADAGSDDASDEAPTGESTADAAAAGVTELPPPDPSSFEGAHRVVNLFAEPASEGPGPTAIDVWGRRTFSHGPVLLAENVGFGEATGYFAAPVGSRAVIVSAGAGPDGEERSALPDAVDTVQVTTVFTNGAEPTSETALDLFERGSESAPAPPADSSGLVIVVAANLSAFDDELSASVGGSSFLIGDGSATCRSQRIEATGVAGVILGEADRVELEVPPGPALISLHVSSLRNDCDRASVIEVTVDIVAGATTTLLAYTRDGTGLSTLALPPKG